MGKTIDLDDGELTAYIAEPSGPLRGGVVLIHEVWGLLENIKDVADRFAEEGYLVVAPDLLSRVGLRPEVGQELLRLRTSPNPAEQTRVQPLLREKMAPIQAPGYAAWAVAALRQTLDYLGDRPGVDGRLAVVGFCFGGTYSFALAAADSRIRLAVPFYGQPPELSQVDQIACPVLAFYGAEDTRLIDHLPEVTRAMTEAGVDFTAQVYPSTGHAFFNHANPYAYNAAAAEDAWTRSLDLLERTLASSITT